VIAGTADVARAGAAATVIGRHVTNATNAMFLAATTTIPDLSPTSTSSAPDLALFGVQNAAGRVMPHLDVSDGPAPRSAAR
jgi:hypothetical protein